MTARSGTAISAKSVRDPRGAGGRRVRHVELLKRLDHAGPAAESDHPLWLGERRRARLDRQCRHAQGAMNPETAAMNSNFLKYRNAVKGSEKWFDPEPADAPEMAVPEGRKIYLAKTCGEKAIKPTDRLRTNPMKWPDHLKGGAHRRPRPTIQFAME